MKNQNSSAKRRGTWLRRWEVIALIVMVILNIELVWWAMRPPRTDFDNQVLLPMSSFEATSNPR